MRKYPLLLLAVTLGACNADTATPTDPMVAAPSFAKAVMNNLVAPIEGTLYSPCTGAEVEVSGNAHIVIRSWEEGGLVRQTARLNTSGISGVSEDGILYNYIVIQSTSQETDISDGLPWSLKATSRSKVVTSGKHTANFLATLAVDYGYDADGNFFVNLYEYTETCR